MFRIVHLLYTCYISQKGERMKKSASTDRKCIEKLCKYIGDIKKIIDADSINSSRDLKMTLAAKYAITQLITNCYELSVNMRDETLCSMIEFQKIRLRTTRQIASHDYDRIDYNPVYAICLQLMSDNVYNELINKLSEIRKDDINGN